jgi:hypothetical protein
VDRWIRMAEVPSDSDPDKTYTVSRDRNSGAWGCSCPHWINRLQQTGQDCKHIAGVKARFPKSVARPSGVVVKQQPARTGPVGMGIFDDEEVTS